MNAERWAAPAIRGALGTAAFVGSFTHVRRVAAGAGQGSWLAWVIASSVDALAVAGALEIRQRKRDGVGYRWPVVVLLLGVGMTLAANLRTAQPGVWGALMAVWPAVAFLAVAGLVETRPATPTADRPTADRRPAPVRTDPVLTGRTPVRSGGPVPSAPSGPLPDRDRPAAGPPVGPALPAVRTDRPALTGPVRTDGPVRTAGPRRSAGPDGLLPLAREIAAELAAEGRALSRSELVSRIRGRGLTVGTGRAGELLTALRSDPPPAPAAVPAGLHAVPAGPDRREVSA